MTDYLQPDFKSMALVTIDTQRDFLRGQPAEIPGTSDILPQMRTALDAFRRAGSPIVHVVRLYLGDGSNVDLCRRSAVEGGSIVVRPGTLGAELAPELLPSGGASLDWNLLLGGKMQPIAPNESVMYKPRWGAFFQTPLEAHLSALRVTSLAFCGCNFPNCPRASIYEASERDYKLLLVEDAVSGLYDRGREEMRGIGVALMKASELARAVALR